MEQKIRTAATTWIGVVLLATFLVSSSFQINGNKVGRFEVWGIFHYYLSAKYSNEVGYFNLYSCALEANQEHSNSLSSITIVRDLHTYRLVSRTELSPCPKERFTKNRWDEFAADIDTLLVYSSLPYLKNVLTDKGFNAPPLWVTLAKPLAQNISLASPWATTIFFNLDIFAILIAVLVIWRHAGTRVMLITGALIVFYFGNTGKIGGNFLQYLWFPLMIASVLFWRRSQPRLSAISLGMAAGLQAFPIVFSFPVIGAGIAKLIRRENSAARPHIRFSLWLGITLGACFLLGSLAVGGPSGWNEWRQKISLHGAYLRGEILNIGLANFVSTATGVSGNALTYYTDSPLTFKRLEALQQNIFIYYFLAAGFLAAVAYAIWKQNGVLFPIGIVLMYALLNLSPYYYLVFALIPFLFLDLDSATRRRALILTILFYLTQSLFLITGYIISNYRLQLYSETCILAFVAGIAVLSTPHESEAR